MTESEATVFVVDDDPLVRESLKRLMESVGQHVEPYDTAREFLEAYDPARPGCLVLDVRMPGMSGLELQKQLAAANVQLPIIFVSGHGDVPMAAAAVRQGALDFMEKPVNPQELLDRIHQALEQDAERRQLKARREAVEARLARLTSREREVVDLAVTGLTNKEIAARLGVTPQAIDARRAKAMEKLRVETVPELVRLILEIDTA